jgi:hypothetical protein
METIQITIGALSVLKIILELIKIIYENKSIRYRCNKKI